jgi:VanZ family protein
MKRSLEVTFWSACLAVAVLSLLPLEHLPSGAFDWWGKAQHVLAFLVLGSLGLFAYPSRSTRVVVGLLGFGAMIEMAQAAAGWRYGDRQDWLPNAAGVGTVYLGWVLLNPSRSHG